MKLFDFDYHLSKELIAQKPIEPRDCSRLMILDRKKQTIKHDYFYNLGKYLKSGSPRFCESEAGSPRFCESEAGDVLAANDSKVIPARLLGKKETRLRQPAPSKCKRGEGFGGQAGGKAEILLLKQISNEIWEALVKNCKVGDKIILSENFSGQVMAKTPEESWQIKFNLKDKELMAMINRLGQVPTPPYIKRLSNFKEYQTIYAEHEGSVAAPTAGFHFTNELMNKLKKQGVQFEFITLRVGLGTFQPVKVENIEEHQMHAEWAELRPEVAERLSQAKKQGRKIIAIGTTSVRTLESFCQNGQLKPGAKWIDLFIYPGYQFRFIEAMITNFHLPKSTLLMLVSAFAGRDFIFRAYQEAIQKKYRFYSFGDAMLII